MEEVKQRISKQVIVMRKDLNMRKGKMVAQGSHASIKTILDLMDKNPYGDGTLYWSLKLIDKAHLVEEFANGALKDWLEGRFTKITVCVNSEAELLDVYNKAKEKGLLCSLITDAGLTEFNGVPTITCCAVGPAWNSDLDGITGHLPLL